MRVSLTILLLMALGGCAMKSPERLARDTAYCRELGYQADSDAMRACVDRQDDRRWANRRVREQKNDCSPECERLKTTIGQVSPVLGLTIELMTRTPDPVD